MRSDNSLVGPARARPSRGLSGRVKPPGDKSVSHRAVMFAGLADGVSHIDGLLEGEDVRATAAAMAALGAQTERIGDGRWRIQGVGARGLSQPAGPIDFGNSGTGCRLMAGLLAGWPIRSELIGDASLSRRPMRRVFDPLERMGATILDTDGHLPAVVEGRRPLKPIAWESETASAQVKSCILLAGLSADGVTQVREPALSRDHTERMLKAFGVSVETEVDGAGAIHRLRGPATLAAADVVVPADPSSAAFLIAAALVAPDSDVTVADVLDNPTRSGLMTALHGMCADVERANPRALGGETVVDIRARFDPLVSIDPDPAHAAAMIDEYPILAVLAAFAEGSSRFEGVGELRVKESDRIASTVAMLRANGVAVDELADGLIVHGEGADGVPGGGRVETRGDHRIAMSALILGLGAKAPVEIDDASMIATSYPSFFDQLKALGADVETNLAERAR